MMAKVIEDRLSGAAKRSRDVRRGREILRPLARRYADLIREVEATLGRLDDSGLEAVSAARDYYSQTNCAWDEYRLIKDEKSVGAIALRQEKTRRKGNPA